MFPCRTVNECVCVFRQIFDFGDRGGDICFLRDAAFPSKKNPIRKGPCRGTLNTCAKFQAIISKNRRDFFFWTLVR